jgi:hypothetical protein
LEKGKRAGCNFMGLLAWAVGEQLIKKELGFAKSTAVTGCPEAKVMIKVRRD